MRSTLSALFQFFSGAATTALIVTAITALAVYVPPTKAHLHCMVVFAGVLSILDLALYIVLRLAPAPRVVPTTLSPIGCERLLAAVFAKEARNA